jgi:hypothetical protein
MPLIGNATLPSNATASGCLHAIQTLESAAAWAYQVCYGSLWKPPAGVTIPQAFAAIGTGYAALAADMAAIAALLTVEGRTIPSPPTGWIVTVNTDGSATAAQSA